MITASNVKLLFTQGPETMSLNCTGFCVECGKVNVEASPSMDSVDFTKIDAMKLAEEVVEKLPEESKLFVTLGLCPDCQKKPVD